MRRAGGAVVGVRGAPQRRVAQRPRRDVQGVGRRPGGIGRRGRITVGAAADVLRRGGGLAGRVLVDRVAFRGSEPERSRSAPRNCSVPGPSGPAAGAASARPRAARRRTRPAAPSGPVWPGSVTAYPVTCPGSVSLNRSRTSTPASRSRAKNPASSGACSAAPVTMFRSTARAAAADSPARSRAVPGWRWPSGRAASAGSGQRRASRRRTRSPRRPWPCAAAGRPRTR